MMTHPKPDVPERESVSVNDQAALTFAAAHFGVDSYALTRQTPWVSEYAINGNAGKALLRRVSPLLNRSVQGFHVLAQANSDIVPAVIAMDAELGVLLLRHANDGRVDTNDHANCLALVSHYATMQARAKKPAPVLGHFPKLECDTRMRELLAFLDPAASTTLSARSVGAAYYLGKSKTKSYFAALSARAPLLEALLGKATQLPVTLNHGDLASANIDNGDDVHPRIADWEHATVGPAGVSLHGLFGGCAEAVALMHNAVSEDVSRRAAKRHPWLNEYVRALVAGNYASERALIEGLPGAICAGFIQSMLRYGAFPDDQRDYRKRAKRDLESGLSDLLDACDQLVLDDRQQALTSARDYADNGRRRRAEKLLHNYASRYPDDAEVHAVLADVLHRRGKLDAAVEAYRKSRLLAPDSPTVHIGLGNVQLERGRFDKARVNFSRARELGATASDVDDRLADTDELERRYRDAGEDSVVPTVVLSSEDVKRRKWRPAYLALAEALFRKYGVVRIQNAFDPALLDECNGYFLERYADYFSHHTHDDALRIGDKRYQISIALEGKFNHPGIYGNPFILAIMRRLLGDEFVLGCTVCATSLPGAKDQHLHKDHRALFANDANDDPIPLPPFAITTMVPLVPLDEKIGTTSVRKGSHLLSKRASERLPDQLPIVPLGSCFLMDMRLSHRGLGNQTDTVRPILNMVYQRYWFTDAKNFTKHPPLRVPRGEYENIPERYRRLFAWGTHPGPKIDY